MTGASTIVGSGPAALACALFAARVGPVRLCARPHARPPSVESVPAATLTLLLELGITPHELDVAELVRRRTVAWTDTEPDDRDGPACAHIDTAALHAALRNRIAAQPNIDWVPPGSAAPTPRWIDATGRRAVSAAQRQRPPRTWTAAALTVAARTDGRLRLACAAEGYAYRLGSAHWATIGWVSPGPPPRSGAQLQTRLRTEAPAWILDGLTLPADMPTHRRPASAQLCTADPGALAIGDAALARDALASQGVSIGLSDACQAADPATDLAAATQRRRDSADRHLRHLIEMIAACRHSQDPCWAHYHHWLTGVAATAR